MPGQNARVRTERGFDRLITFADAVVAIALTLLVLPLTEIARDLDGRQDVWEVLGDHKDEVGAFVLSFVVIWIFWSVHHRTMEYFAAYDGVLLRLTLVWLFTIVVLPFVTQLLSGVEYDQGAAPLYDGVLLVSSLALVAMSWWGHRRPGLLRPDGEDVRRWLAEPTSLVPSLIIFVTMVLSIFLPGVGSWPLLALVFDDRIQHLWLRLRGRR
jgi:uncharacterized membrane protein